MHERLPEPETARTKPVPAREADGARSRRHGVAPTTSTHRSLPADTLVRRVAAAATRPADRRPVVAVSKVRDAPWIQRAAVTATDKGTGTLTVDTGGDMDANHIATDWTTALDKTKNRDVAKNTVITDVEAMKNLVGNADFDGSTVPSRLKSIRAFRVPNVPLWQIDKAGIPADAASYPPAPDQTKKTVTFKTKLVADDGNKKSRGNPTTTADGPVFLVTGVDQVS